MENKIIIPFPQKKYNVIYADPPWEFGNRFRNGSATKQHSLTKEYPTMKHTDLKNLPIKDLAEKDCALFIWTTDAHLSKCVELIKHWGFTYKTIAFNWLKQEKSGKQVCYMGIWTMKASEICLLATKGRAHKMLKSRKVRQLVIAVRNRHSAKPDEVRYRIEEMFGDVPKIELFARNKYDGWDSWGNEVK